MSKPQKLGISNIPVITEDMAKNDPVLGGVFEAFNQALGITAKECPKRKRRSK